MFNQNGQCPECGGWGARYTLCQDCEDSGMIYEISHGLTPMETMNQNQGTQSVIARNATEVEQLASCVKTVKTLEWSMNLPLQSRQVALDEVNLLCEFTMMHKDLRAKRARILQSEMPSDLLTNSEPETSQRNTHEWDHWCQRLFWRTIRESE